MSICSGFRSLWGAVFLMFGTAGVAESAQRTFVASYGSDANACTISAPCRAFSQALIQTDAGGEIIVLDSAGYGPVTIDRSVSIIASPGVYAGISVASGDGVTISGSGIAVVLRGLTINGQGGDDGIVYTFGAKLHVENCVIAGMTGDGILLGYIGEVAIKDTVIRDNGNDGVHVFTNPTVMLDRVRIEGNGGDGVDFVPSSGSMHKLVVRDSFVARNQGSGIVVSPASTSDEVADVTLVDSTLAENGADGVVVVANEANETAHLFAQGNRVTGNLRGIRAVVQNGAVVGLTLTDNLVSGNPDTGIRSDGSGSTVIIDRNTVTQNGTGLMASGAGRIKSRGNNTVMDNGIDVFGVAVVYGGI